MPAMTAKHAPIELTQEKLSKLIPLFQPGSAMTIGGIWGQAKGGMVFRCLDGDRLILHTDPVWTYYLITSQGLLNNGKAFQQFSKGFIDDVRTYAPIIAGKRATGMAILMEFEMNLLMGLACGASGIAWLVIKGTDLARWALENREKFGLWWKALKACRRARRALKSHAPTLYDNLFDGALLGLWLGTRRTIGGAMADEMTDDPRASGLIIGETLGALGEKAFARKLSVLGTVWTLLLSVAVHALRSVPLALSRGVDPRFDPEGLIRSLRELGVEVTHAEALKIFAEVAANARHLEPELAEIKRAFDAL